MYYGFWCSMRLKHQAREEVNKNSYILSGECHLPVTLSILSNPVPVLPLCLRIRDHKGVPRWPSEEQTPFLLQHPFWLLPQ